MTSLSPQFGSLYVIRTLRNVNSFPSEAQYNQTWKNINQATYAFNNDDPVTMIGTSGGSVIKYSVTLPDGNTRQVILQSEPEDSVLHIISGVDKTRPNNTLNRAPIEESMGFFKKALKRLTSREKPLTVEEVSDQRVEDVLRQHQVSFLKFSFDA